MIRRNCVDLFCGAGGMTAGLLQAAKRKRIALDLVAVNHWDTAINSHSLNHPNVRHICEPVENLIPAKVVPSRRLHLLAAGCECTFHSNARGGGPCNEQSRSQAWQLVRWATDIEVENILMENVREFMNWGPLHPVNHRPIKSQSGEFFQAFVNALRHLGYTVEYRVQCAADYGDPTSRQRFLLIARKGRPITWPKPTHCDPAVLSTLNHQRSTRLKPWRVAREIIDWSLPGTSIFNRKKPLCANTLARIEAGLRKFGGPNAEPFIVVLRGTSKQQVNGSARSLDEPLPTLTAGGGHCALVEPEFILPPEGFYRGNTAKSLDQPLPTITASRGRAFQLVRGKLKPFVLGQQSCAVARSVDEPLPTVATAGAIRLVEPFLYSANHGVEAGQRAENNPHGRRVKSLAEPVPTLTSKRGLGLCEPILVQTDHQSGHGIYAKPVSRPLGTVVSKQNQLLVQPILAKFYGTGVCQPVTEPLDTVTTKDRFMLVEFKAGRRGRILGTLDILTRMLQPHELKLAHSFPRDYQLTGTKEDQTTQIGNSVPVNLSAAHGRVLL